MAEFKDFSEAPTPVLTFGTPVEEAASVPVAQEAAMPAAKEAEQIPVDPQLTEESLTPEERKMVDDFSKQIDLHDSNGILQYGAGTQKKMADFSENALKNVRTKDLGEVGDMITNLVTELKSFDTDEEKGFLGIFKKNGNKIAAMKTKYDKAEVNVEKICTVLEDHQVQLMKDVALLDKMYNLNLSYFKELSMYILAGKKRLEEVRATEVKDAFDKAQRSNLPEDAQAAKDLQDLCDRFEKKLHDLELTRMIAIQTGPQIRLVQSSDTMMIEKIQSTVVNTIPLWKSQMVIALGVEHANQAAQAQKEVTDMTNALLKKNAEKLKVATVESAKASERGIVDLETLKNTNATLISTLDEVIKIQEDGRQKRREAENELNRMEQELKNKLLEVSN
ncbi:MAG: toxic anion resistance protein [Lachnospiraceae bacterium]|nr:toxic anion resistance protein [Lachnospiraceae bacterium]